MSIKKPFVIKAVDALVAFAKANGYDQNESQVHAASVGTVLALMGIDPGSNLANKYAIHEATIKRHVIASLFPSTPTDEQKIRRAIKRIYPKATLTSLVGDVVTLDLNRS
jgi:hypothetical protein